MLITLLLRFVGRAPWNTEGFGCHFPPFIWFQNVNFNIGNSNFILGNTNFNIGISNFILGTYNANYNL